MDCRPSCQTLCTHTSTCEPCSLLCPLQLRDAANPKALRAVLVRWVPNNLQDVVACLPGAEAGGQRAVGEQLSCCCC